MTRTVGSGCKGSQAALRGVMRLVGILLPEPLERRCGQCLRPLDLEHMGEQIAQARMLEREPVPRSVGHAGAVEPEDHDAAVHYAEPEADPVRKAYLLPAQHPVGQPAAVARIVEEAAIVDGT